jgi:hypothetical protein
MSIVGTSVGFGSGIVGVGPTPAVNGNWAISLHAASATPQMTAAIPTAIERIVGIEQLRAKFTSGKNPFGFSSNGTGRAA